MTRLFANENVELSVVLELRKLGHDVLTSMEAGRSNRKTPDADVLQYATSLDRAVLTHDWRDFRVLHRTLQGHGGIIGFPPAADSVAVAQRIDSALAEHNPTRDRFLRVTQNGVRIIERPAPQQTVEPEAGATRAAAESQQAATDPEAAERRQDTKADHVRAEPPDALLEE